MILVLHLYCDLAGAASAAVQIHWFCVCHSVAGVSVQEEPVGNRIVLRIDAWAVQVMAAPAVCGLARSAFRLFRAGGSLALTTAAAAATTDGTCYLRHCLCRSGYGEALCLSVVETIWPLMLFISHLDLDLTGAGLVRVPGPGALPNPVGDRSSIEEEPVLQGIVLGIGCCRGPGYGGSGNLRAGLIRRPMR